MKSYRVVLSLVDGFKRWVERVEGKNEKDVRWAVYQRYGLRVYVIKANAI